MFESLFGAEMPLAVRFFLAFLIVLGLIGATAWAVRRFGAGRLGGAGMRGRQPRLAVIDYASVDARRRLILVRRDNVEHLLMIGGPTDVVVEPNIVRAVAAPREVTAPRPPAARRRCRAPSRCRKRRERIVAAAAGAGSCRGCAACAAQRTIAGGAGGLAAAAASRSAAARRSATRWPRSPTNFGPPGRAAQPPACDDATASAESGRAARRTPPEPRMPTVQPEPPPNPQQRPIRALPRWRIASKRRCASRAQEPTAAMRARRAPRRAAARGAAAGRACSAGGGRTAAAAAATRLPRQRAPRARPKRRRRARTPSSRARARRSTTVSNRRWRVCWAVRRARPDAWQLGAAASASKRWRPQ